MNLNFEFLDVHKIMTRAEFFEITKRKKNEHKISINIYPFENTGAYFIYKAKKDSRL